jgi:hypothetical protein
MRRRPGEVIELLRSKLQGIQNPVSRSQKKRFLLDSDFWLLDSLIRVLTCGHMSISQQAAGNQTRLGLKHWAP